MNNHVKKIIRLVCLHENKSDNFSDVIVVLGENSKLLYCVAHPAKKISVVVPYGGKFFSVHAMTCFLSLNDTFRV